ncbi:MAG: DNA polymerase III subunit alpha [PVC group bacterium]
MFPHLHCHSYYSFLRGTASPAELALGAAERRMGALALTDRDGIYGAVEFYRACRETGIKPILGVELTEKPSPGGRERRAVLLARNRGGWERICELTTARHLADDFSLVGAVREAGEDVFILTAHPELVPSPAPPTCFLELTPGMSARRMRELSRAAESHRIVLAAANDLHFPDRADDPLFRLLAAIRARTAGEATPDTGKTRSDPRFWDDYPAARAAARRIADGCGVELELGRLRLPRYPLPPGETAGERLRALCRRGVRRRYRTAPPRLRERLQKELAVIVALGMADYFLLVEEIARFARRRGIPLLGRGSAANSLVCYLLGLTGVDPLRHNLYFERFLNAGRTDPPDIDLDFPTHRREEVIEWIYRRFGPDRVATLSTTVRFRARSALGETARAMGLGEAGARRLTRHLPYFASLRDPDRLRREVPECRSLPWGEPRFRDLVRLAGRLEGLPHHLSVHPSGVVIAPEPLTRYLALERAAKGIAVTQPDMYSVKQLGLLKIDILGQRALAVVEDVVREVRTSGRRLDLEAIDPAGDRATGDLIAAGRTVGCFYIESPVMRSLLKRLRCRDFETLVAASSVIRPGVSNTGCAERYIARRRGREKPVPIHPLVDAILDETCGVMIYQEQVMRVVSEAAGMSPADADEFRRCMSKKPGGQALENYRARFLRGATANRIPEKTAAELWRQIEGFASYAFCKAHSASFARLSFQTAYLKAHYPARFMAALISRRGGFYPTGEYVQEARRMGLKIHPPDVNRSGDHCRAEGEGIRIGLMEIKNLGIPAARRILAGQKERPFSSWEDFLCRVRPDAGECASLIRSGALASLGPGRAALAWHLAGGRRASPPDPLFPSFREESGPPLPRLIENSIPRREDEAGGMGFSLLPPEAEDCARKLQNLVPGLPLIRADELLLWAGREVQMIGSPVTSRLVRTRGDRRLMKFLTLEDAAGLFEVILFPDCYARFGHHLVSSGPFYVRGLVQVNDGALVIVCRQIILTPPVADVTLELTMNSVSGFPDNCRDNTPRTGRPACR